MPEIIGNEDGRREVLALHLARGLTVRKAAEKAQVSERTAYNWRKEKSFSARVRELRTELFAEAAGRLAGLNGRAAAKLGKLLKSANERVSLQAAVKVLELGSRLRDDVDFDARLAEVERLLKVKR
jgi:transposase